MMAALAGLLVAGTCAAGVLSDESAGGSRRVLRCGVVTAHEGAGLGGGGECVESTRTGAPGGAYQRSHRPRVAAAPSVADSLWFGPFGFVHLYRPPSTPAPEPVVLFVSGDGGWALGVVNMARELAASGALVVGIDIRPYLARMERGTDCAYPAADLEALSQFVQQRLGYPVYHPPILVGYSSGATFVYATLAQAPPTTFAGAISLGFCADLIGGRPLCRGSGLRATPRPRGPGGPGYVFQPVEDRALAWIVLQGTIDQVCLPDSTRAFVARVQGARLVSLPGVGHGFGVTRRWLPQLQDEMSRLARAPVGDQPATDSAVRDLPLVEVPARGPATKSLVVMISGDGGWASLDRDIANVLADSGLAVVGLNALQYFWAARTPEGTATDLGRVVRHYLAAWGKDDVILAGYSRGAEVLPFVANRLPADLRSRLRLIAMVAPEQYTSFTFRAADLLFDVRRPDDVAVVPELRRVSGVPVLCFYGEGETDSACLRSPAGTTAVPMPGGHHVGGAYTEVARRILRGLQGILILP